MNEEQASTAYYDARSLLESVIESGHRGDVEDILNELREDLE